MQTFELSSGALLRIEGKMVEELVVGQRHIVRFDRVDDKGEDSTPGDNVQRESLSDDLNSKS